ncbi:MAG: hypothetical protein EHM64_00710 [Ignavibacteriae bacterium]|nr:MAG: hypothetical protein EHM64_00710 [Ignavibacteriota bacterium]
MTYIRTIDIAHPPLSSGTAEELLDDEVRQIRSGKQWRVLKVIHGIGKNGRPAVLKQTVLNWAYRNRKQLKAVIPGENFNILDAQSQEMRKQCGQEPDADLGATNSGMTILWIK